MLQPLTRRSKNWQFSHAAAAMGAFWERARKSDDRRIRRVRQMIVERTRALVAGTSESPVAGPSLRRSC
jgi:hypothetical protein